MATGNRQLAAIGEVMVELSPAPCADGDSCYRQGFGGDTFNTVVGAARLGLATSYVTLLGDDPFSDRIVDLLAEEGVDTSLVARVANRQPGLYTITNSADGERSFSYWRNEAPARQLWQHPEAASRLEAALMDFRCIYLSGITLAIMAPEARTRLKTFLVAYRRGGGQVAFDSNFRQRLWPHVDEACSAISALMDICDIALLTIEDEQALWGTQSAEHLMEYHRQRGVEEIVMKRGGAPVGLWNGDGLQWIDVPPVANILDTTGAGDGFNAGYLAARLAGADGATAVVSGNRAAAAILTVRGGIGPRG